MKAPLKFSLPFPPSVNHYYKHTAVGGKNKKPRAVRYLSKRAKEYRKEVEQAIQAEMGSPPLLKERLAVIVDQFPGRRTQEDNEIPHVQDIDNCLKPLFDAMEKAGVYANDKQIDELLVRRKRRVAIGRVDIEIRIKE